MPFKSLKTKLDIAFLIVLIIPFATATIFSINYLSQRTKEEALARVSSNLDLVVLLMDHESVQMRYVAQSCGQINYWALFLNLGLTSRLNERLCTEAVLRNLDEIVILDRLGKVASANTCSNDRVIYPVPDDFAKKALNGEVSSGLELIAPTRWRTGEQPVLSLTAWTPLYFHDQTEIIGAVVIRRFIRSEYLQQTWPLGLVPNTFVFARETLIASNVSNPAANQSGLMNQAIARALYEWGEPIEEANLEPGGYLAKYRPLIDAEGALVGALMVKMSVDSYVQARSKAFAVLAVIAFLALFLTFFIKYLIQRNILGPIRELTKGTRRVANGDYSYRLEVTSQDEIGALAQSFDQMAAKLDKRTAELQSAHRRLQDIIEFLPDATLVIDRDKKVIAWNRAIEEMTGMPKGEVLGKGNHTYAIPFYGEARPMLIDLVTGGEPASSHPYDFFEKRGAILFAEHFVPLPRRVKGAYLWATASPLFDQDDNLIGAIESIRDITGHKEAERSMQESESRLRQLSSRLLTAQEEERKRVAREVHDSIASSLAAINISLGNCLSHLERGLPAIDPIKVSISITLNAMEESRRIMSDLRPSVLDDLGILATITWLCRQYETIAPGICIENHATVGEEDIPELVKIAIFRVLQEALNNIVKHSKAELVNLSLLRREGCLELTIEDNGVGFSPADTAHLRGNDGKGLGIAGMRERTELSGGTFAIDSTMEKGTFIRCLWKCE